MARRMVSETAQKVLKSMEMANDTNMVIGTNLEVDGKITTSQIDNPETLTITVDDSTDDGLYIEKGSMDIYSDGDTGISFNGVDNTIDIYTDDKAIAIDGDNAEIALNYETYINENFHVRDDMYINGKRVHLYDVCFYVSDMYVHCMVSNVYNLPVGINTQVNSGDDYTTCILTVGQLNSLKSLLSDMYVRQYPCYIVSDNNSYLTTGALIYVESNGTGMFELSYYNNNLVTDSTGYADPIYLIINQLF